MSEIRSRRSELATRVKCNGILEVGWPLRRPSWAGLFFTGPAAVGWRIRSNVFQGILSLLTNKFILIVGGLAENGNYRGRFGIERAKVEGCVAADAWIGISSNAACEGID